MNRINLNDLAQLLERYFNMEELKTLCFDLLVDYDSLPGNTRRSKIRELLMYLERRNQISDLLKLLKHYRPNAEWDLFEVSENVASPSINKSSPLSKFFVKRKQGRANYGRINNLEEASLASKGIPYDLNRQLRMVLLDCGPFATAQELTVIFVDKRLSPWRNRLPQAANPIARVESIIDFLYYQHNDVEENALVLLLQVLSERFASENICHHRLAKLADELGREVKNLENNRFENAKLSIQTLSQNVDASAKYTINKYILAQELIKYFSREELEVLCFELNIKYGDLRKGTLSESTRDLLEYLERRNQISDLLKLLKRNRPNVNWDSFTFPENTTRPYIDKEHAYIRSINQQLKLTASLILNLMVSYLLLRRTKIFWFVLSVFIILFGGLFLFNNNHLIITALPLILWVLTSLLIISIVSFSASTFYYVIRMFFVPRAKDFYSLRRRERYQIDGFLEINNLKELSEVNLASSGWVVFQNDVVKKTFCEMQKEVISSLDASSNYNKLACLNRAQNLVGELQVALESESKRKAKKFDRVLKSWLHLIKKETQSLIVQREMIEDIPNPFIPGQPIQADSETVFRGRQEIFREILDSISPLYQPPTLVLYGARRSGKTSLLNQLPQQVSKETIPVFVNLQEAAGTAMEAAGFIKYLVDKIRKESENNRKVSLPEIDHNDVSTEPYLAFSRWLRQCSEVLKDRTLFITFDEYEWVDKAIDKGRLGEEVLSFFRNLIQQDELRLILLFAGVHTLSELKYNWPSYFINTKSIKVSYLPEADARRLLTNPTLDFPLDYVPDALDFFIEQTRCQPYLIQLVAFEMIIYLNSPERKSQGNRLTATIADVEVGISKGLMAGNNYFAEMWKGCNSNERIILADLAAQKGLPEELSEGKLLLSIQSLERKDILEKAGDHYQFQVPLVARWVRENKPPKLVRAEVG